MRYLTVFFLLPALQLLAEPTELGISLFSFKPPQVPARGIWLAGDFNNWNWDSLPLEKQQDGSWSVRLPFPPGEYRYLIKVDDRIIPQPLPLIIGRPWHIRDPQAPSGTVVQVSFPLADGPEVSGWLYTPGNQHPTGLILFLHGNGGSSEDWLERGKIQTIADNLIHQKKIPPTALFIPDLTLQRQRETYLQTLAEEIPRKIQKYLPKEIPQNRRALVGVSQGGAEVYGVLREYATAFGAYGALSGWWDPKSLESDLLFPGGPPPPLSLWCGSGDGLIANARTVHVRAQEKGLPWPLMEGTGGHNWECWNRLSPQILLWIAAVWTKEES